MTEIMALEPQARPAWWVVLLRRLGRWTSACEACGHIASTSVLVVDPFSLARQYRSICGREACRRAFREWEGSANRRRQRAIADREHERGWATVDLLPGMPPQYPSVSRATLRAFLDSGFEVATIANGTSVSALMGSIKALGFQRDVYAEMRSGETVIRRMTAVEVPA